MARTAEDIVRVEVHYCVSFLVSTLAGGASVHMVGDYGGRVTKEALQELCAQALELIEPIDDWEEAAIQAGWSRIEHSGMFNAPLGHCPKLADYESWQELCEENDIEPYQREVFEHWIVSDWLADRLAEKGEKVDKDFAGLTVWARTTTGQGIASDSVIEQIVAELNKGA